jgi:hypothetical protein
MDLDILSDVVDGSLDQSVATGLPLDSAKPVTPQSQNPSTVADKQEIAPKPNTLRDQISSALKGETSTPSSATQDGKPARNPDGTFAPVIGSDPTIDVSANNPGGATAPPVAAPPGIDPQVFNSLPAETQTQLARTMDEINTRQRNLYGYEQIERLIAPRRDAWALNGVTEAQAVTQLFALSDYATRDPAGFIQYFAQQNNIDLEDVVFGSDPGDPEVNALKQQITRLESQINGFSSQQQAVAHNGVVNEIVSFFEEKSADGNLLRPYAEKLGDDILGHIQMVMQQKPNIPRAQVLQEAYDRACWSNANVRAEMQKAQSVANEAERMRQQQEKVAKARNAGSSVPVGVPSATAQSTDVSNGNLRDDIRKAMAVASNM